MNTKIDEFLDDLPDITKDAIYSIVRDEVSYTVSLNEIKAVLDKFPGEEITIRKEV